MSLLHPSLPQQAGPARVKLIAVVGWLIALRKKLAATDSGIPHQVKPTRQRQHHITVRGLAGPEPNLDRFARAIVAMTSSPPISEQPSASQHRVK